MQKGGAPKGNQNRKGKTGQKYGLSYPKLTCGVCKARDWCPIASPNDNAPCGVMKRMRKIKLDTIEDIRELRKHMLMQNLIQLEIMSIHTEKSGVSGKEMIAFRKNTMQELTELERDTFNQTRKRKSDDPGNSFVLQLIQESKAEALEAEYDVDNNMEALPAHELGTDGAGDTESSD